MKIKYTIRVKRLENYKIGMRHVYCICVMLIIMAVASRFYVESHINEDYVRHIQLLYNVRARNESLLEFLKNPTDGTKLTYGFEVLFGYNTLRYIIAKTFQDDYVLSWVCVFITYSTICSIALDWKKDKRYLSLGEVLFVFILCFALLPFFHACSGMRTAVSSALAAYAIFGYLYKGKTLFFYVAWTLLGFSFHTFVLLTVPFVFLSKLDFGIKGYAFVTLAAAVLQSIAQIFYNGSIQFLRKMAVKFIGYTSENQYTSWRFCYYGVFLLCLAAVAYHILCNFSSKEKLAKENLAEERKLNMYKFISYYSCFTIGTFYSYSLVVRQGYIIGAFAPVLATLFFEKGNTRSKFISAILLAIRILVMLVAVYVCYRYVVLYARYYV